MDITELDVIKKNTIDTFNNCGYSCALQVGLERGGSTVPYCGVTIFGEQFKDVDEKGINNIVVNTHEFNSKKYGFLQLDVVHTVDTRAGWPSYNREHRTTYLKRHFIGPNNIAYVYISNLGHMLMRGTYPVTFGRFEAFTKQDYRNMAKYYRDVMRGKYVMLIYDDSTEYADYLKAIQNKLRLFKKKPFFKTRMNNMVHPTNEDYLNLVIYKY